VGNKIFALALPGGCGTATVAGVQVSTWDTTNNNTDAEFMIAIP
jgi:hypothetical protein